MLIRNRRLSTCMGPGWSQRDVLLWDEAGCCIIPRPFGGLCTQHPHLKYRSLPLNQALISQRGWNSTPNLFAFWGAISRPIWNCHQHIARSYWGVYHLGLDNSLVLLICPMSVNFKLTMFCRTLISFPLYFLTCVKEKIVHFVHILRLIMGCKTSRNMEEQIVYLLSMVHFIQSEFKNIYK